ncbi:uncharacterized protein LOC129759577 [Uranotaenia lowii]|uniref:uncharacterized protein LOC129759577 n=1 Tax=Uranotaenia lowii TaxID=190385 RepID=UPI00247AE1B3|nr:uncharacterized protein LOC129759577 [Uranotaenia lowii]
MNEGGGLNSSSVDEKEAMYENEEHLEDSDDAGPSSANHSRTSNNSSLPTDDSVAPRLRTYTDGSSFSGPWVVFIRPKANGKQLNVVQITKDLARWPSVTCVTKVRPNKLRVVVDNHKSANEIVASKFINLEYHVYIPSRNVEIEGVISEMSLEAGYVKSHGVGKFKSLDSTSVEILDCRQLNTTTVVEGVKKYSPSASFRVTFAGTALPHYVLIDGVLRLPVRLFVPRPMECKNCIKLGHTASHCCSKKRCPKCGEVHGDGACSAIEQKCIYCGGSPHDISLCEAFKSRWDSQRRSLKERSKRSYAAILKGAAPPIQPQSSNIFTVLPVDNEDTTDEENPFIFVANSRKRSKPTTKTPKIPNKIPTISPPINITKKVIATDKKKQVPPGFRATFSPQNNSTAAGTSKAPVTNADLSESTHQPGLFKFSDILNGIFTFFNVSESIRSIVSAMLPMVKTFLKQLMQTWPLLSVFISLDG